MCKLCASSISAINALGYKWHESISMKVSANTPVNTVAHYYNISTTIKGTCTKTHKMTITIWWILSYPFHVPYLVPGYGQIICLENFHVHGNFSNRLCCVCVSQDREPWRSSIPSLDGAKNFKNWLKLRMPVLPYCLVIFLCEQKKRIVLFLWEGLSKNCCSAFKLGFFCPCIEFRYSTHYPINPRWWSTRAIPYNVPKIT